MLKETQERKDNELFLRSVSLMHFRIQKRKIKIMKKEMELLAQGRKAIQIKGEKSR